MSEQNPKFCWGCGAVIKEGQKFCTKCGKPVIKKTQASAPVQPVRSTQTSQRAYDPDHPKRRMDERQIIHGIPAKINPVYKHAQPDSRGIHTHNVVKQPLEKQVAIPPANFKKIEDRLEKLEYKINSFDFDNKLIDLNNQIKVFEQNFNSTIKGKLENMRIDTSVAIKEGIHEELLGVKDDLQQSKYKISKTQEIIQQVDFAKLEKLDQLDKLDRLNNLDSSEGLKKVNDRLAKIEDLVEKFQSDEKIVNLAKNTVDRLNTMDERIANFNVENRSRLSKIDEKMEGLEENVNQIASAVKTLIPSLVVLTRKINELQDLEPKAQKKPVKKTEKKSSLDLPPFPQAN